MDGNERKPAPGIEHLAALPQAKIQGEPRVTAENQTVISGSCRPVHY
jgi:hypothetical protein